MVDVRRFRRSTLTLVALAALLAGAAPWTPFNRPPSRPSVRSQVTGASRGHSPTLKVSVNDPDGDLVDVTFLGRKIDATPGALTPFTLVVIPDPQKYVSSADLSVTYREQMRWIDSSRTDLGTAFVMGVGDLVQTAGSAAQWARADAAWRILDDARIPYSVVPGNHDVEPDGDAPLFDRYFSADRFDGETWYGGWLGDPTDGIPDPIDRGNKDSYQFFSAGGMDFLVLNLEVDLPADAVLWAESVLEAFPDRHAILVTHRWMGADAVRWHHPLYRRDVPSVSPERAWEELVATNCSIFMVIAGHDPGESRRVDMNTCGEPVFQLMADYQRRPRGGDGWLRYYTIEPGDGVIEAHTFSVTRGSGDGAFESDDSSRFTLAWSGSRSRFAAIDTAVGVPSGTLASVRWSDLDPMATYEWYAVATDGALVSAGRPDRFTTP
jgi:3',5'-cyclic AMP phosphodiesterase CpdA